MKNRRLLLPALLPALILFQTSKPARAGSATWNLNPTSGDWNTAANWTPNTIPNGPDDIATFDASQTTNVVVATATETAVGGIVFNAGASSYTVTVASSAGSLPFILEVNGLGIMNNSGVTQHFANAAGTFYPGRSLFFGSATAGDDVTYANEGGTAASTYGGSVGFYDNSTAGSARITNYGGTASGAHGGTIGFADSSTAGNATIIENGGTVAGAVGAYTLIQTPLGVGNGHFVANGGAVDGAYGRDLDVTTPQLEGSADNATFTANGGAASAASGGTMYIYASAGSGTFTANGGQVASAAPGSIYILGKTHLATARLVANGGVAGAEGGRIFLEAKANGGEAQLQMFGNGAVDISSHSSDVATGSIEGDGPLFLGSNQLSVGSNNLSTTFSGIIQDGGVGGGSGGSLSKIGATTLTLSGANLYTGGTTVTAGILATANKSGSATGTGVVQVNEGTVGGSGTISGAVTVNAGAFLAPATGTNKQTTLIIQSALTFNADATYTYTFKAKKKQARTDKVVANGVTINGATFAFQGTAQGALKQGLVLTAISNTAATAIAGTFANLPDGAILTVNGNNFQANYEGGDGNNLTLTVVP